MAKHSNAVASEPVAQQAIIATAEASNLPAEAMAADWGACESIDTNDLLVPKVFHQQAMSKFVSDGVARPGDFCDSLSGTVLCKKENALEVIVFGSYKTMTVKKFDDSNNRWEFDHSVTITPENAKEWAAKPFAYEENGWKWKNELQYNFYVLLPSMINELPYVLSLGGTKSKAAKKLNTMLFKLATLKKPGASVVFELKNVVEKNDKGSWFGLEVGQGRATTADELALAYAWYKKSKTQKFVAAEEPAAVEAASEEVPF